MSGKELHCQIDTGNGNRLSWQVVPDGERFDSLPFGTQAEAESFMNRSARILGYLRKEID